MLSFELASQHFKNAQDLRNKIEEFAVFKPPFISLTTHHPDLPALLEQLGPSPVPLMPHISCRLATQNQILKTLDRYHNLGIHHLLILRGDLQTPKELLDFQYASDLISFIKMHYGETFELTVAAYPEGNAQDIEILKLKLKAGATRMITQYSNTIPALADFYKNVHHFAPHIPLHLGILPSPLETDFFKQCQSISAFHPQLHIFKANDLAAAKISRLLKVLPRV